ncbi:phosphoesterase-domain-containing protein, partial [Rhizopus microsporus var. microsporus]
MHISFTSLFAIASLTSLALASNGKDGHQHGHKGHGNKAPKGKVFDHFLQIWFENQDFEDVAKVPGFTDLAKQGILLDNFNAITHPSEPNYVCAGGGDNFGIDNDDYYNIPANVTTIYDLLENKGLTWKVYQENIPSVGYTGYKSGTYVRKHNPAVIFDSVGLNKTRLQNIVGGDQFVKDIASGDLPNWMFYTPDMNDDAHDTNASFAGEWLSKFYKSTLNNKEFLKKTLILITFDENKSTKTKRNRVWSLLMGDIPKKLRGTVDSTFYSHFSTLNTVELNWELGSLGRQDTNKTMNNVYSFAAKKLHYKNKDVPESEIPSGIPAISGLLTGRSWNQTHLNSTELPPQPR